MHIFSIAWFITEKKVTKKPVSHSPIELSDESDYEPIVETKGRTRKRTELESSEEYSTPAEGSSHLPGKLPGK